MVRLWPVLKGNYERIIGVGVCKGIRCMISQHFPQAPLLFTVVTGWGEYDTHNRTAEMTLNKHCLYVTSSVRESICGGTPQINLCMGNAAGIICGFVLGTF